MVDIISISLWKQIKKVYFDMTFFSVKINACAVTLVRNGCTGTRTESIRVIRRTTAAVLIRARPSPRHEAEGGGDVRDTSV
jgi:hypothetical protein